MSKPKNENDLALLVGITNYPNARGVLGDINASDKDCLAVREWLISEDGGNIPVENCKEICVEEPRSYKDRIDDYFDRIIGQYECDGIHRRRFYFYFSGHGFGKDLDDTLMVMPEWSSGSNAAAISSREYLTMIWNSGMFEQVFMCLDCCRTTRIGAKPQAPRRNNVHPRRSKTFVGMGTQFDNVAYWVTLGESVAMSIYTKVLVEGLTNLTVKDTFDLAGFLRREVPIEAKNHKYNQEADEIHYFAKEKDILLR